MFPAALIAAACLASDAGEAELVPYIVNGLPTHQYAAVGALLEGGDPGQADSLCTGTLIGCQTFLTAAHCVCPGTGAQCQPPNAPDPARHWVYLPHAGVVPVESIAIRQDFSYPVGDVAIVRLATPVNGVRPAEINTVAAPPFGTPGTIVGYGRSGGASFDYGIKRRGAVTTGACPLLVSPTTSVCWTFDAPIGAPGDDSNTCNGDSGGPLFVDLGAGPVVAGVTSGGTSNDCFPTDQSYDANVYVYRNWIASQGGADLELASCGALPPVGDAATDAVEWPGSITILQPEARTTVEVAPGATMFRVAMNAVDDGLANFDLYVKRGAAPTESSYDCARTGTTQYGVCDFEMPAAGTWHLLVRRVAGSGSFQVTATRFGASALDATLTAPPSIAAGGTIRIGLAITNGTDAAQAFSLVGFLVAPGGLKIPWIPARGHLLASGARLDAPLSATLPPDAPLGVWMAGAALWQKGAGMIDRGIATFEVR